MYKIPNVIKKLCHTEAKILTRGKPQNKYAKTEVSRKAMGIVTLADTLNPTNITPARRMGEKARKNKRSLDIDKTIIWTNRMGSTCNLKI